MAVFKQLSCEEYTYLKRLLHSQKQKEYDLVNDNNVKIIDGISKKFGITLDPIMEVNE